MGVLDFIKSGIKKILGVESIQSDVDYEGLKRNSKRLYYSNDGLMFYSPDHGKTFYYVN